MGCNGTVTKQNSTVQNRTEQNGDIGVLVVGLKPCSRERGGGGDSGGDSDSKRVIVKVMMMVMVMVMVSRSRCRKPREVCASFLSLH